MNIAAAALGAGALALPRAMQLGDLCFLGLTSDWLFLVGVSCNLVVSAFLE